MRHVRPLLLSVAALAAFALPARADGDNIELAQYGRLLMGDDSAVTGDHQLTFTLWESPVKLPNETAAWKETYGVTVVNGIYSATLGANESGKKLLPASTFAKPLYLSITVDASTELAPRLAVGRVPLAYQATLANTALVANDVKCVGCIDAAELSFDPTPADGSVTSAKLADGAVIARTLAAGAITLEHLSSGSVTDLALAVNAVTTAKLANGAVTREKLAAGAVGGDRLASGAIEASHLAAGAVTAAAIGAGQISANHLADGAVTASKLSAGAITNANIAEGTIRWDRLEAGVVPTNRLPPIAVAGKACAVGQVVTAFDTSGAPVCSDVISAATGLASYFPTKWAASPAGDRGSGELPGNAWTATGNKAMFLKTSATSKLRVTVSDNLRVPTSSGSYVHYDVRVNGTYMNPRCMGSNYYSAANATSANNHMPFSLTCVTESMPAGLYTFETVVYGALGAPGTNPYLHWNTGQPLILVEEIAADAKYRLTRDGTEQAVTSKTPTSVNGRTVNYDKQSAGSVLRLTLSDTLRAAEGVNGAESSIEIRMDGSPLPSMPCTYRKHDTQGVGANFHDAFDLVCLYPGIGTGNHTFTVWALTAASEAYVGWTRGYPLLMVEELTPGPTWSYATGTGEQGELSVSKTWTQVPAHTLTHAVTGSAKNLKLSYSDTWRAASGCNGDWGSVALYMDGKATGCYTSMHVSGSAGQNHHRALNLTCVVRDVAVGSHTFSVWYYNNCGSSYFTWARGQYSMQAEELP